jgi:hypothetical protein
MESENKENGIVKVEPKPNNGFTSKAIDLLEKIIVKLFYDSSVPHHWLAGNFAPVQDETPPVKDLPVKGHLPVSSIASFVFVNVVLCLSLLNIVVNSLNCTVDFLSWLLSNLFIGNTNISLNDY